MSTALSIEYRRLGDIVPADVNPKDHDIPLIRASLERHGFVEAILDDARTGKLIGGHGRIQVLAEMMADGVEPPARITVDEDGMWQVPVSVGYESANDQDAAAVLVGLNQTTTAGGWIDAELAPLLAGLDDLAGVGFAPDDVERMLADVEKIRVREHDRRLAPDEFPDLDPDALDTPHECPRCGYEF